MKKLLSAATVLVFIFLVCEYTPAEGFRNEPIEPAMLLAQQTQESANEQSETPRDEIKEAALDPYVMIRNAYVQNRNKLIAE